MTQERVNPRINPLEVQLTQAYAQLIQLQLVLERADEALRMPWVGRLENEPPSRSGVEIISITRQDYDRLKACEAVIDQWATCSNPTVIRYSDDPAEG